MPFTFDLEIAIMQIVSSQSILFANFFNNPRTFKTRVIAKRWVINLSYYFFSLLLNQYHWEYELIHIFKKKGGCLSKLSIRFCESICKEFSCFFIIKSLKSSLCKMFWYTCQMASIERTSVFQHAVLFVINN